MLALKKYLIIVDPYLPKNVIYSLKKAGLSLIAVYSTFTADKYLQQRRIKKDEFEFIFNESDGYSTLLDNIKNLPLVGVMIGFDSAIKTALKIAHDLHLSNSIPLENSDFLGNKYLTGKYLQKKGLFPLKQIQVNLDNKKAAIESAIREIGFPLIIKPTNSAGSFGFALCYSDNELLDNINVLLNSTDFLGNRLSELVIQERMEGTEYAVCTISSQMQHKILGLLRYEQGLLFGQNMIRAIEFLPSEDSQYESIIQYTKAILNATHFSSGPAATEIMLTKKGPCLIELNPRVAGINVEDLLQFCTPTSQGAMLASIYSNEALFLEKIDEPVKAIGFGKIIFLRNGKENTPLSQEAVDEILNLPSCKQANFKFKTGEKLPITKDIFSVLANILMCNNVQSIFELDCQKLLSIEKKYFS